MSFLSDDSQLSATSFQRLYWLQERMHQSSQHSKSHKTEIISHGIYRFKFTKIKKKKFSLENTRSPTPEHVSEVWQKSKANWFVYCK